MGQPALRSDHVDIPDPDNQQLDAALRSRILKLVDPKFARYILGQTDSELLFYIFLSRLARRAEDIYNPGTPHDVILASLQEMLTTVLAVAPDDEKEGNAEKEGNEEE